MLSEARELVGSPSKFRHHENLKWKVAAGILENIKKI